MSDTVHQGGCMCGELRYRLRGEPLRVGVCHCETCRRNTGAPFAVFLVYPRDRFELLSGDTGVFQSSPEGRRRFCRRCGSPVYSDWSDSHEVDVQLGSLDEPERFPPGYELWTIRRPAWLPDLGIPRFERDRV